MADPTSPKPICVIRIPRSSLGGAKDVTPTLRGIQDHFDRTKPDYHWFILPFDDAEYPGRDEVEFEVFYDKDWKEITAEELKAIIEKALANAADK